VFAFERSIADNGETVDCLLFCVCSSSDLGGVPKEDLDLLDFGRDTISSFSEGELDLSRVEEEPGLL